MKRRAKNVLTPIRRLSLLRSIRRRDSDNKIFIVRNKRRNSSQHVLSTDTIVTFVNDEDRRGSGDARIYIDDDGGNVPSWVGGGSSSRGGQNDEIEMQDLTGDNVGDDNQTVEAEDENHAENENQEESKKVSYYLKTYFRLLFYVGLSLYKGEYLHVSGNYGWINKVAFVMLFILAILNSLDYVKYFVLEFFADRTMLGYVTIGFFLNRLLCRILFYLLSIRKEKKLNKLFSLLKKDTTDDQENDNQKDSVRAIVLLVVSITVSIFFAWNPGLPYRLWTSQYIIGVHTYRMEYLVTIWTIDDYENITNILYDDNVQQDLTVDRYLLAMLGIAILCVGNVVDSATKDVMLLCSVTLKNKVDRFKKKLKNAKMNDTRTKITVLRGLWDEHHAIKAEAAAINKVYGGLFTLMHINNLLLFAYFLLSSFEKDKYGIKLTLMLQLSLDIAKVSYTYYVAAKASSINKDFLKWIHTNFVYQDYDNPEPRFDLNVAMDELRTEAIGIGKGGLIITENFIFRLWTVVTSYFVFLADAADNDEDDNVDDDDE